MKYVFLGIFTSFSLALLSNIYLIPPNKPNFASFEYFVLLPDINNSSIINALPSINNDVYAKLIDTEMSYLLR